MPTQIHNKIENLIKGDITVCLQNVNSSKLEVYIQSVNNLGIKYGKNLSNKHFR